MLPLFATSRRLGPLPKRKRQTLQWLSAVVFLALVPGVAWIALQRPSAGGSAIASRIVQAGAPASPASPAPAPAAVALANADDPVGAADPAGAADPVAAVAARPPVTPHPPASTAPTAPTAPVAQPEAGERPAVGSEPGRAAEAPPSRPVPPPLISSLSPIARPLPPVEAPPTALAPFPAVRRDPRQTAPGAVEKAVELVYLTDGTTVFLRRPALREGETFTFATASGLDLRVGRSYIDFPRTYETFLRPPARAARLEPPRLESQPRPVVHLPAADPSLLTGSVRVAVLIGEQGEVKEARVVREDLPSAARLAGPLRQAALAAARQATFRPARVERRAQPTWVVLEYRFGGPGDPDRPALAAAPEDREE